MNDYDKDENNRRWKYPFDFIKDTRKCLHLSCPECQGTGRKKNGTMCVHMISCPCPRCTPTYMAVSR